MVTSVIWDLTSLAPLNSREGPTILWHDAPKIHYDTIDKTITVSYRTSYHTSYHISYGHFYPTISLSSKPCPLDGIKTVGYEI